MFGLYFTVFCAGITLVLGAHTCDKEGYTWPDETNCRNYYICRSATPVLMTCPTLLYWNCYNSTCARMRQGSCCPNDDSLKVLGLNIPCINGIKIPAIQTCNKYYLCVNNKYEPYYCPAGQKFDPILMRCRTAMFGACATPKTTTTRTTTTGTGATNAPVPNGIKIPNIFNCNQYYTFENWAMKTVTCPNNQYYNCWQKTCSTTKSPLCCTVLPTIPGIPAPSCPTNGVVNSKPLSCVSYYKCVDNKVTTERCPFGQAFDAWTSTCMAPLKARCSIKPGLTVCQAASGGSIPFGSVNFNITVTCPKW